MSRLEQRWRTPLNAISVVNGRIPRIKRKLNAYCALRTSLRACLVQNVYTIMLRNRIRIARLMCVAFSCVSDAFASASYPLTHQIDWQAQRISVILSAKSSTYVMGFVRSLRVELSRQSFLILCVWTQVGLPAEFKHISKRRKRKWTWFP